MPDQKPRKPNEWARYGAYTGLAFVIPITCWVGFTVGEYFDHKYASHTWANVGLIVGLVAGLWETYRQITRMERNG